MRAISGGERAVLAGDLRVVSRLRIHNADGTWKELTNLSGAGFSSLNFLSRATWGTDIDAPTWTATFELMTKVEGVSIAPFVTASPANVDDASAYAPLCDIGRRVEFYTSVVALGATPGGGDERLVFTGYVSAVQLRGARTSLVCSDLGWPLVNTQIEEEREYADADGELLEDVLQAELDDVMGAGAYTLVTPVSPGWMRRTFTQPRVKMMEALRAEALLAASDARFRWAGAAGSVGTMELQLFAVDRAKTVSDATFGPGEYFPIASFDVDAADLRNAGRIFYREQGTQVQRSVSAEHAGSIAQVGRRYFEAKLDISNVDTEPEAQAMVDAAVHDLALPKAEQAVRVGYFWPAEPGDLYTFQGDGLHYDSDQQLAVTRVSHTIDPRNPRQLPSTTLDLRGTVAGAYRRWLDVEGLAPKPVPPAPDVYDVTLVADPLGFGGTIPLGVVHLYMRMREGVAGVHVYGVESSASPVGSPQINGNAHFLGTAVRPGGQVGRVRDRRAVFPSVTTPLSYRRFALVAFDALGRLAAPVVTDEIQVVDASGGETLGNLLSTSLERRGSVNRIHFHQEAPSDPSRIVQIVIVKNGMVLYLYTPPPFGIPSGPAYDFDNFIDDTDVRPNQDDTYALYQVDQLSGLTSAPVVLSDTPVTAIAWANGTPAQSIAGGVPRARYDWTSSGVVGATELLIEKSQDHGVLEPWAIVHRQPWAASGSWLDPDHAQRGHVRFRAIDGAGDDVAVSVAQWWNGFFTIPLVPILPYMQSGR